MIGKSENYNITLMIRSIKREKDGKFFHLVNFEQIESSRAQPRKNCVRKIAIDHSTYNMTPLKVGIPRSYTSVTRQDIIRKE